MEKLTIILPYTFIAVSEHEGMAALRKALRDSSYYREHDQKYEVLPETLKAISEEGVKQSVKKVQRAADALLAYAKPDADLNMPCPNFLAFYGMARIYFARTFQDGWLYSSDDDGCVYPEAIDRFNYKDGSGSRDTAGVYLNTTYVGIKDTKWLKRTDETYFGPSDVTNRRIPAILAASGYQTETPELRQAYDAMLSRFDTLVAGGFAHQFRVSGKTFIERKSYHNTVEDVASRKVIHDTEPHEYPTRDAYVDHAINEERVPVPFHPIVRVFDLKTHEFFFINATYMAPYVYDDTLGENLILPEDHRDLLDILTTDLDAFLGDVVEGKSAGNVVLSKGPPGVGKTLTAEVYSEMIHRPLYSIHSGSLGTTPDTVNKRLTEIFKRSQRWNCVLLLDEADVFVMQRGSDIQLNAIVAEFLRAMEYFDGLLFMTTNRPDDIDDAILSRCAAIIDFYRPDRHNAARLWKVMARNFAVELSEDLIAKLVEAFPEASGRDIKMLFRLALRVALAKRVTLDVELFRKCAMFRGVQGKTKFEK